MGDLRVGRVTSVDYESGTVSVLYRDRDNQEIDGIPILSMNNEYLMPKINDMVLVAHLSNKNAVGIMLGKFYNDSNPPAVHGKNIYHKEYTNTVGKAYTHYDSESDTLTIYAKHIKVENEDTSKTIL